MTLFLDLRQPPSGFAVAGTVTVLQATLDPAGNLHSQPYLPGNAADTLAQLALGRHVVLVAHGFNVSWTDGQKSLANWEQLLALGPDWLYLGVLWPGNSSWLGPLCYPGEGAPAMQSGDLLARFIAETFSGAASISLVSHSLGGRVLLEAAERLGQSTPARRVRHAILMAGAINHDCFTGEYPAAVQNIDNLALLASQADEVLAAAFPLGNLAQGLLTFGHPWFMGALGRSGPSPAPPARSIPPYQVPRDWDFGHGSYLEIAPAPKPPFTDQSLPPPSGYSPPQGQTSAWSAAYVRARLLS